MNAAMRCLLSGIAVLALSAALPAQARTTRTSRSSWWSASRPAADRHRCAGLRRIGRTRPGPPVIVDNKPGANTIIAAEAVASAPADGYTLMLGATNHSMIPALYRNRVKLDAVKSFKPVCALAVSPTVLVVGPSMPVKSLAEWLKKVARQAQAPHLRHAGHREFGPLRGGTVGQAGARVADTRALQGRGAGHRRHDGRAGRHVRVATLGSVLPQIKAGKLTALAVASRQRRPSCPTYPPSKSRASRAIRPTPGTACWRRRPRRPPSSSCSERQAAAYAAAPGTAEKLGGLGMEPQTQCGEGFARQIEREVEVYSQLARDLRSRGGGWLRPDFFPRRVRDVLAPTPRGSRPRSSRACRTAFADRRALGLGRRQPRRPADRLVPRRPGVRRGRQPLRHRHPVRPHLPHRPARASGSRSPSRTASRTA